MVLAVMSSATAGRGDDGADCRSPGGQWLSPHVCDRGSRSLVGGIRRLFPARRSTPILVPLLAMIVGATILAPCACQLSSIDGGGLQMPSQERAGAGGLGGGGGGGETRARGTTRVGLLAMGVFWKGLFRDAEIMAWGNLDITTIISFSHPVVLSLPANFNCIVVCSKRAISDPRIQSNPKLESRHTLDREHSTVNCDRQSRAQAHVDILMQDQPYSCSSYPTNHPPFPFPPTFCLCLLHGLVPRPRVGCCSQRDTSIVAPRRRRNWDDSQKPRPQGGCRFQELVSCPNSDNASCVPGPLV
jgi:hypothetical protein